MNEFMTTKIYIAGEMLKKGNQLLREQERNVLSKIEGIELYNPMDQKDINDKTKSPTAEMIFAKDTIAILGSDVIVVDADNDAIGTSVEVGQIWGINYMLKRILNILDYSETDQQVTTRIVNLLNEIPVKEVYWHNSDVRNVPNSTETGLRRSFSLNQYLHGCLLDMSGEARTFEEIVEELKK